MDVRILDLDGSVAEQTRLRMRAANVVDLRDWGPRIRLACGWRSFARFERDLNRRLSDTNSERVSDFRCPSPPLRGRGVRGEGVAGGGPSLTLPALEADPLTPNPSPPSTGARGERLGHSHPELVSDPPGTTWLTFVGSGDFHHVTLALLRRLSQPCNLLVIDNHPDWMWGVPVLHCGTWLRHAARLPHVQRIFHVGGDVDFDNRYRWLAPWRELRSRKIEVIPAVRTFGGVEWSRVDHQKLRAAPDQPFRVERLGHILQPSRQELLNLPLYITLDRDVLRADEAVVNWDSGHLVASEVLEVIRTFLGLSAGLLGMDVVGDWSPMAVRGPLRRLLHWIEHPRLAVDPREARERNERLNLELVELLANRQREPVLQPVT